MPTMIDGYFVDFYRLIDIFAFLREYADSVDDVRSFDDWSLLRYFFVSWADMICSPAGAWYRASFDEGFC